MRRYVWALALMTAIAAVAFATCVLIAQPNPSMIEIPEHLSLQVSDL